MNQGRSSSRVTEPTKEAGARSGLGLSERTAGAAGTAAVVSSGGGGVDVYRVVRGILSTSQKMYCAHLCSRGFGNKNDE